MRPQDSRSAVTDASISNACDDTDGDGGLDLQEQVGPNGGDGNFDGIPDSQQPNVAAILDANGNFVVLEVEITPTPNGDCKEISSINLVTEENLAITDSEFDYPYGLVEFALACDNNGDSAQITYYWYGISNLSQLAVYRKFGPGFPGAGSEIYASAGQVVGNFISSIQNINGQDVYTVAYELTDDGLGDDDIEATGIITDPTGPAILPAADADNDGIANQDDLDDDNDGILDSEEAGMNCGTFEFNLVNAAANRSQIAGVGSSTDVLAGDKYVFGGGLTYSAGSDYDVVITIVDRSATGPIPIQANNLISVNGRAIDDNWVEFEVSIVEAGSATIASPTGIPVVLNDFTFILGDVDSKVNATPNPNVHDIGEVVGFTSGGTTNVLVGSNLEPGGFDNGGTVDPSFQLYRLRQDLVGDPTNWTDEGNSFPSFSGASATDFAVRLTYASFSSETYIFGSTGTATGVGQDRGQVLLSDSTATVCVSVDTDGDGILDQFDTDSDNDGCPDAVEAAGSFTTTNLDPSDLGLSGQIAPLGSANMGIPTQAGAGQATTANVTTVGPDVDSDGIADACDLLIDSDGDGVADSVDVCPGFDADSDGVPNGCDQDDDNDGILDADECGVVTGASVEGPNLVLNANFNNAYANWTSDFNRGSNNEQGGGAVPDTRGGCTTSGMFNQGWVAVSAYQSTNGLCATYYDYNGGQPDGSILITDPVQTGENMYFAGAPFNGPSTFTPDGFCEADFVPFTDGTLANATNPNNTLYIDPNDIAGSSYWRQTVPGIVANTSYRFRCYIYINEQNPELAFIIGGTTVFNDSVGDGSPGQLRTWQEVTFDWNSGTTSGNVTIEIANTVAGCNGNDIRLDDITFARLLQDTDGDGTPDCFDTDSDNDGCADAIEAGGNFTSANIDGATLALTGSVNTTTGVPTQVGTGQATTLAVITEGPDADNDGIADACDPLIDTDGVME